MNAFLMLRYVGEAGPIQISVNGFVLINEVGSMRSASRLEPYVLPGNNRLRLDATAAPNAKVDVEVVFAPADGKSLATPLIQVSYPDPRAQAGVLEIPFRLPPDLPVWNWAQLQPAPAGVEATLQSFLARVGALLARGPDDELLRLVAYRHTEVATALGYAKTDLDQGLIRGLASRRANPSFRVDVATSPDLVPLWSPDRRLLHPLRRSRQDAILLGLGGRWLPFPLHLGHHRGNWIVIR